MKTLSKKDIALLKRLCEIQSSRTSDSEINQFIEAELLKIEGVTIGTDEYGNIYAVKGEGRNGYKAIVSHTDTVHFKEKDRVVIEVFGSLIALAKKDTFVYKSDSVKQVGVGGDDKAGVFKCIKAMQEFDDIKSAYFRFEESGCLGSRQADMSFFEDCNFVLQSDRKGNNDFITTTNGIVVASKEFEKAIKPQLSEYGFSIATGSSTDVGQLKHNGLAVSCANISSGYYGAHSDSETINLKDLERTYNLIKDIFDQHGETRFEHKKEEIKYSYGASQYRIPFVNTFSNSMDNNYFAGASVDDGPDNYMFFRIPGTKAHKLIIEKQFTLNEYVCNECSTKGAVTFFPDGGVFYCDSAKHGDIIDDYGVFEHVQLKSGKNVYVYDRASDLWYNKDESMYYDLEDRYLLKEHLSY
jgi:putative aminopeptidase FrvX